MPACWSELVGGAGDERRRSGDVVTELGEALSLEPSPPTTPVVVVGRSDTAFACRWSATVTS